jgi:ABC-type transport system involved in multi-copper enzyme maturation permease subunit
MTAPPAPPRARLARYATWHLRDYLRDKGFPTLITICLIGFLTQLSIGAARTLGADSDVLERALDQAAADTLGWLSILGALFATNGIVADDRKRGYFRLLFAKPVSVVAYYAYKFAAYGLGFAIVAAVAIGLYNLAVERFFPVVLLPIIALLFVALGGIGFLLSAAWRFDWLSLTTVLVVSRVLWLLFGHDPGWRGKLVHALPPIHLVDGVYLAVRAGRPLPLADLVWLVGYGAACLLAGLIVVRRRPLAAQ